MCFFRGATIAPMQWFFSQSSSSSSPNDDLRTSQEELRKTKRIISRAIDDGEVQEKRANIELRNMVYRGESTQKITNKARALFRIRRQSERMQKMADRVESIVSMLPRIHANQAMCNALSSLTSSMKNLNDKTSIPQFSKLITGFQREMAKFDEKSERMEDTLEQLDGLDDEEEEIADEEVQKFVSALLLDHKSKMPTVSIINPAAIAEGDEALMARLNALRPPADGT
jgi:division protein CdvB (Snf7/Vps24/ESCRT-III family)